MVLSATKTRVSLAIAAAVVALSSLVSGVDLPSEGASSSSSLPTKITQTVDGWPSPIVIKGNKFFNWRTQTEFRIKGMAYYPRPNAGELSKVNNYDWAADEHDAVWRPHIAIMQDLGVNTIRLYSVDPSKSHDDFMCACASAGIYVIVGMAASCTNCGILDLAPPKCYPDFLFERMQAVYNAFAVYDNVLAFSVGNEVNLLQKFDKSGTQVMPCVKALLRDVRNYAASCSHLIRRVPIGLDLADIEPRQELIQYMDCLVDENEFTRAQWLGFNPYVECDPIKNTQYAKSEGLKKLMAVYKNAAYTRPLMFGEYGCNLGANTVDGYENQRSFFDAKWMNEEPEMTSQIVGGNAFEFVTEVTNTVAQKLTKTADKGRYGVGFFSPDTCDHADIPCVFTPYPEYANLKKAYTTTKAPTLKMENTTTPAPALECPSNISTILRDMPERVEALQCASQHPKCNGGVSNEFLHTGWENHATLGGKANPNDTGSSSSDGAKKEKPKTPASSSGSMSPVVVSAATLAIAIAIALA